MSPPTPLLKLSVFWKAKCLLGSHMSVLLKTEICRCETKFWGKRKLFISLRRMCITLSAYCSHREQKTAWVKILLKIPTKIVIPRDPQHKPPNLCWSTLSYAIKTIKIIPLLVLTNWQMFTNTWCVILHYQKWLLTVATLSYEYH